MEYGGLHQLLRPSLPLLDELPLPQQGALRVAFGHEAGPPRNGSWWRWRR